MSKTSVPANEKFLSGFPTIPGCPHTRRPDRPLPRYVQLQKLSSIAAWLRRTGGYSRERMRAYIHGRVVQDRPGVARNYVRSYGHRFNLHVH